MSETPFVDVQLFGFFAPDFVSEEPVVSTVEGLQRLLPPPEAIGPTRIHDARALQQQAARSASFSEAAFFDEHGFVLLSHESAVRNWDFDPSLPEAEHEVVRVHQPEAEALIRSRLLPGKKLEVYQGTPVRRGPGTMNPDYATGVHQDYGIRPEAFEEGLRAFTTQKIANSFRWRFAQDDVVGFLVIDLWRPVYLDGPLLHMPLAVCEPHSVRLEDCVPLHLTDITPTGLPTNQLGLRARSDQRWYYYPDMTRDEVLAFKNFEFVKNADPAVEACFHSAFTHPDTPPDAPPRQSVEHRVSVFFVKD